LGKENEKKLAQRRKKKLHIVKERKKTLAKATKALGLAKRLRQSQHLLKIQSIQISLEQVA